MYSLSHFLRKRNTNSELNVFVITSFRELEYIFDEKMYSHLLLFENRNTESLPNVFAIATSRKSEYNILQFSTQGSVVDV